MKEKPIEELVQDMREAASKATAGTWVAHDPRARIHQGEPPKVLTLLTDDVSPVSSVSVRPLIHRYQTGIEGMSTQDANYVIAAQPHNLTRVLDELELYREALKKIACYDEGETVAGSFDEPGAAKVARAALEGAKR